MEPVEGRQRVQEYGQALLNNEIRVDTLRSYLGILRRYFSYVLEFPFVSTEKGPRRLQELYGPIDQPVTEYDLPQHVYEGERQGLPLDPEKLYDLYVLLRKSYLNSSHPAICARNYTFAVLAGESGLRADELLNLEINKDLFFESILKQVSPTHVPKVLIAKPNSFKEWLVVIVLIATTACVHSTLVDKGPGVGALQGGTSLS